MSKEKMIPTDPKVFAAELREKIGNCPKLDLHGVHADDEIEIRTDQFLVEAIKKHEPSAVVVYGIGKGVLRRRVIAYLKQVTGEDKMVSSYVAREGSCLVIFH